MSEANLSLTQKIDILISDCYQKCTDILIQGRNAIPLSPTKEKMDNSEYCREILRPWKNSITQPLSINLFLLDPTGNRLHLLEQWTFYYQRKEDPKECRLNQVNLKIVTFLRTLYSFVRLLPGFQLLNMSSELHSICFSISNPSKLSRDEASISRFITSETSHYTLPNVNTLKGILSVSVRYLDPFVIQEILRPPTPIYTLRRRSLDKDSKRQLLSSKSWKIQSTSNNSVSSQISKSYETATSVGSKSSTSSGRKLNPSPPESIGMSYSPTLVPSFLIEERTGSNLTSPLMNNFSNHPLPSLEDGVVQSSPPYPLTSYSLVSTSPNVGSFGMSNLQNIMMNIRGSQTLVRSNLNQSFNNEVNIGKLPPSPFDQQSNNQLSFGEDINQTIQTPYYTYIKPKNMDKFVEVVVECNRKGLPIDLLAMNDEDEIEDIDLSDETLVNDNTPKLRQRTSSINENSMAFVVHNNNSISDNNMDDTYEIFTPLNIEPFKQFDLFHGSKTIDALENELQTFQKIRNTYFNKKETSR